MEAKDNRETWLRLVAERAKRDFEADVYPTLDLDTVRIGVGFTGGGTRGSGKTRGECWHRGQSDDSHWEIIISNREGDSPEQVIATTRHQTCLLYTSPSPRDS